MLGITFAMLKSIPFAVYGSLHKIGEQNEIPFKLREQFETNSLNTISDLSPSHELNKRPGC
jgi:hypothetical protein